MFKRSSILSWVLRNGCIVCLEAFIFLLSVSKALSHPHIVLNWFCNNFMDEWREAEIKHRVCTVVLILRFKAFYQESVTTRSIDLKIKCKHFLEGYSVNKESKNTRSWRTDSRLNIKCSRFTRTSLKSFCSQNDPYFHYSLSIPCSVLSVLLLL